MAPDRTYTLISADGHFNEPGDLWTSRVAADVRRRRPPDREARAGRRLGHGGGTCASALRVGFVRRAPARAARRVVPVRGHHPGQLRAEGPGRGDGGRRHRRRGALPERHPPVGHRRSRRRPAPGAGAGLQRLGLGVLRPRPLPPRRGGHAPEPWGRLHRGRAAAHPRHAGLRGPAVEVLPERVAVHRARGRRRLGPGPGVRVADDDPRQPQRHDAQAHPGPGPARDRALLRRARTGCCSSSSAVCSIASPTS